MKSFQIKSLTGALLLSVAAGAAHAATPVVMGQSLSPQQIKALPTQTMTVGGQKLRVLVGYDAKAGANSSQPKTLVINSIGAVGESYHEVLVSQVTTEQARAVVNRLRLATTAANYYQHTGITSLRFASFEQAVWARDQLVQQLPTAVVAVPVQYAELKTR